jgi:hypothetical protein
MGRKKGEYKKVYKIYINPKTDVAIYEFLEAMSVGVRGLFFRDAIKNMMASHPYPAKPISTQPPKTKTISAVGKKQLAAVFADASGEDRMTT